MAKHDRVPPNDIGTEQAVLGAMLLDQDAAAQVFEILDETCFFKDAHRVIFLAALKLYQRNDPIDIVTMTEVLNAEDKIDAAGGAEYLADLVGMVASPANAEHHAWIVRRKSILRKLIHSSTRTIERCYEEPDDLSDLLEEAEREIFHLMQYRRTSEARPIGPILLDTFERLGELKANPGGVIGVPSGFTDLDRITSGWQAGDMIVLAGRPSMGKTAFSLILARNAAVKGGAPVGFFSLEMSWCQLGQRFLSAESGIDSDRLRSGFMQPDEWELRHSKITQHLDTWIFIDDTPGLSVTELRSRARRLCAQNSVGLIVIDYIGLMEYRGRYDTQQQKIAEISRHIKALAKDLNIPIIVLSQLSRAVETRQGDKRPILSDLRDSGALEQDADVVLFIYRPGVYDGHTDPSETEIIIAKQRNGPTGVVKLYFDLKNGRFVGLAKEQPEEAAF